VSFKSELLKFYPLYLLWEDWSFRSAGDDSPAAGGIVGCGVARKAFCMVFVLRFWVD